VKKYLGSVVPTNDNFYAALNSAVFLMGVLLHSQGVIVNGTVDLLSHQQFSNRPFERTLIVAEEGAYVSYLEGCTAPKFDRNQLHRAVVELIALDDAEIKY